MSDVDLIVYKYVNRNGKGGYETPFQNTPIKVNSLLVAESNDNEIVKDNYKKYMIEDGAIHSCLSSKDVKFSEYICLKAIIPAGTEFWVQDDMKQVASRQLYITDEVITDEQHTDMTEIYKQIYNNAPSNKDGIKIGDVFLSNGKVVSPLSEFDKNEVIGYVGYFHPDTDAPICIAKDNVNLPFATNRYIENSAHSSIGVDDVENDFDGLKHTNDIAGASDYDKDIFKAIEYCHTYKTDGTKEGEWYLPAIGEVVAISRNMTFINVSINIVGVGDNLNLNEWMWSSSQYSGDAQYTWCCGLSYGCCYYAWDDRGYGEQVRPFRAFITQA
ncbi:MAG: hypothetical protein K2H20_04720 [Bacilli bacterium]|nr:hypothetical protein [Bacilli bacterium]